ncbi:MAG: cystathionine gamma-synthase [Gemmatimonadota bacterium]|nr:cystathionine gamma-synthase [Gemmatimonadota bacterium]
MAQVSESDLKNDIATRAIHAGQQPDPATGAIMTPIFQTSTFVQPKLGEHKGFEYARTRNPTRDALERNLAALEGGRYGFSFSSGMAATETVLKLLSAGDHVVSGENLYGGAHRLMVKVMERFGLSFTFVDERDPENFQKAITSNTKLLYVETPTNPMMRLADLTAIGALAKENNLHLVVDNTFATPIFQNPLKLGATIVLHSTTKFLNGHSDMVGGVVITSDDEVAEQLAFLQNSSGGVPGPFDCWLTLRGTKTLPLRMWQHDKSGRAIAEWLSQHSAVEKIYYPGLESHPQHELAKAQMTGFGGMISFDVGSLEKARRIVENTELFSLAESLGGVESLIGHPASMTHASVPADMRKEMGLTDGLVRLSVGVEHTEDLMKDLEHALDKAK